MGCSNLWLWLGLSCQQTGTFWTSGLLPLTVKSSVVALGWGREYLTWEVVESEMKRFGQNESCVQHLHAEHQRSISAQLKKTTKSLSARGWEWDQAWGTGTHEDRWQWGLTAQWWGSWVPHHPCKACLARSCITERAFHLVSVGCVIYGFCGVIFLHKGKGYFSKCYICIAFVRKNNVNFFLS